MNELNRSTEKGDNIALRRMRQRISGARFQRLFIILLGSALVIVALLGAVSPVRYWLSVGMVPTSTIFATRDVVDEITTQNNRNLAAAAVTPIYQFADGVTEQVVTNADSVFTQISAVRQYAQTLPDYSTTRVYTEEELTYAADMLTLVTLRDYQLTTLMRLPRQYDELLASLRSAIKRCRAMSRRGRKAWLSTASCRSLATRPVLVCCKALYAVLREVIEPNMVVDQVKTDAAEAAMKTVEPVIYKQGQSIVVRGEGRARPNSWRCWRVGPAA